MEAHHLAAGADQLLDRSGATRRSRAPLSGTS